MLSNARRLWPVLLAALFAATSCGDPVTAPPNDTGAAAAPDTATEASPGDDYHSFANTQDYRTRHIDLDLSVDFNRKVIVGTARLWLERLSESNPVLVLDTRDLTVNSARAGGDGDWHEVRYSFGKPSELLGTPLNIELPEHATSVEIRYETAPNALGLQWLSPEQTAGKHHPFLYSQAQSIQARSFVPLQDTPGVRITYTATVRTPPDLRAVMGASNEPNAPLDGVFEFDMPQAIPSYLLAIAVGDLDFQAIGPRTGIYAEREILDAAAAEFADTEEMLETAEAAYGPYRWGRYDLLVLPPSFPFGGMENPRLSFVTPTLLAGDKSLVSTIAHELAHSWSGNLVTNATWRDLWLNEGFTTYLTYRIMQVIYGDERYRLELALGYAELREALEELEDKDELLAVDVHGRDSETVFTSVPYEKGALFLYELEQAIGRDAFDKFLLDYFNAFAFRSIATEEFLIYLDGTLLATHADKLDAARIRQWVFEPGLPEGAPVPTSEDLVSLASTRHEWLSGNVPARSIDTSAWTYHHWKLFLDGMPKQLRRDKLEELDETFALTGAGNSEIAFSWLRIAIRNHYDPAYGRLEEFLHSIGRLKFIRVLYKDMLDAGMSEMARDSFATASPGYHPLAIKAIGDLLTPE